MAHLKRLRKDLISLQKEPLLNTNACPSEDDLTLWNGVILVEITDIRKVNSVNNVTKKDCPKILLPFHFTIDFSNNYPMKAPNVGFSTEFPYSMGAAYTIRNKPNDRLNNKFVLCLDLLGNFDKIHTEWENSVGSGWSPAYTVSTLLINLQALISGLDTQKMHKNEKIKMINDMEKFAKNHPELIPDCVTQEQVDRKNAEKLRKRQEKAENDDKKMALKLFENLPEIFKNMALELEINVQDLKKVRILAETAEKAVQIDTIRKVEPQISVETVVDKSDKSPRSTSKNATLNEIPEKNKGQSESSGSDSDSFTESNATTTCTIDENICCYITGSNYTEDILGYGLSIVQRGNQINFSTPAELLSYSAFTDGCRHSTTKLQFEYFLPAFINFKDHVKGNKQWYSVLRNSIKKINDDILKAENLSWAAIEIFGRLINTLCVEMMKCMDIEGGDYAKQVHMEQVIEKIEDGRMGWKDYEKAYNEFDHELARNSKAPSIAYFEAVCSLWRTYYFLAHTTRTADFSNIKSYNCRFIEKFTSSNFNRHKNKCSDIGALLVSYSVIADQCKYIHGTFKKTDPKFGSVLRKSHFIKSFLEENYARQVRYWFDEVVTDVSKKNQSRNRGYFDFKEIWMNASNSNISKIWRQTQTSNDNIGFQLMFLNIVISNNLVGTAQLMDDTNGKCPARVEQLQQHWKAYKKEYENVDEKLNFPYHKVWFKHVQFPQLFDSFKINKKGSISDCEQFLKAFPGDKNVSEQELNDIRHWKVNVWVYQNVCRAFSNGRSYWSYSMKNMVNLN